MTAKKYPEACRLFEASYKLEEGLGTLLNMAKCHEEEGKIASAWGDYNALAQKAARVGAAQNDRRVFALSRVAALEPRLSRLRVQVPIGTPAEYEVKIAGNTIPPVLRNAGVYVDPGIVQVSASAKDFISWQDDVIVQGEGLTVEVSVPPLAPKPKEEVVRPVKPEEGGHKTLGYVLAGTGVGVLAGGLIFGGLALGKASDAKGCPEPCNATGADGNVNPALQAAREAYDQGKTFALLSNIFVIGGVLSTAVGAYFIVSAPKATEGGSKVKVGSFGTLGTRLEVEF